MIRHTFNKKERLTGKKTFDFIFSQGKRFTISPFRCIWTISKNPLPYYTQIGISVPKKLFPKATDRNTIKRRIREAYRKNKHLIYEVLQQQNIHIAFIIIYTTKEELHYQEIEQKMILSLQKLTKHGALT